MDSNADGPGVRYVWDNPDILNTLFQGCATRAAGYEKDGKHCVGYVSVNCLTYCERPNGLYRNISGKQFVLVFGHGAEVCSCHTTLVASGLLSTENACVCESLASWVLLCDSCDMWKMWTLLR